MFEQLAILVQIIFIDIVMAADNAIVIGMVSAGFAPKNRRKIIIWGVAGAFVFRIIFALSATYLFQIAWVKIIGGVLLLWICNSLRQDLFDPKKVRSPSTVSRENETFMNGVYKVLITDISLSLDNVIGVAGAAKDYYYLLVIGLVLSVMLIGAAASYFAEYIKKHQWVGYVGLAVILIVAIQLILSGMADYNWIEIKEPFKKFI